MAATILVVDDEPRVRELLRRWLEGWGYVVTLASSATDALEVMLAAPASILVCDIRMSGHDGFWLIDRVRTKWPGTAVIMASGVGDLDVVAKAQRVGAVDFVTKPFGRELLWQAVSRAETRVHTQAKCSTG